MKEIDGFVLSDDLTVLEAYKGKEKNIAIPKGVKVVKDYVFMGMNIRSVVLNEELEQIGHRAFQTTNIKEIVIPASVFSIGYCAFNCCYKLKKVTILNPKVTMYTDSFDHCYKLEYIYFNGTEDEWFDTIYDEDDGGLFLTYPAKIHLKDGKVLNWR